MTKAERQLLGRQRYIKAYDTSNGGTLDYCMRFGKTRVALNILMQLFNRNNNHKLKVIIIVPSLGVLNHWNKELEEYKKEVGYKKFFPFEKVQLSTSHTIVSSNGGMEYDLAILDEIHTYMSKEAYKAILAQGKIKYPKILGLTGTYPTGPSKAILDTIAPVVDKISEKEGIDNGWISKFLEFNLALDFSMEDKAEYVRHTNTIRDTLENFRGLHRMFIYQGEYVFRNELDLLMCAYLGKSTKLGYLKSTHIRNAISKKMGWNEGLGDGQYAKSREYWEPRALADTVRFFYTAVRDRNDLISNNTTKLSAVLLLIKKFNAPTVCFNESQIFAEAVVDYIHKYVPDIKAVCYHSSIKSRPLIDPETGDYYRYGSKAKKAGQPVMFGKKSILDATIQGLNEGVYKVLSVVKAIDTGVTLQNVQVAILSSGTVDSIQYRQRVARVKTLDIFNPDRVVIILNLYFDDFMWEIGVGESKERKLIYSRDKVKLETRQKNSVGQINIKFLDFIDMEI